MAVVNILAEDLSGLSNYIYFALRPKPRGPVALIKRIGIPSFYWHSAEYPVASEVKIQTHAKNKIYFQLLQFHYYTEICRGSVALAIAVSVELHVSIESIAKEGRNIRNMEM